MTQSFTLPLPLRILSILCLCLILTFSAQAQDTEPPKVFNAEYYTLDNGMEVVVIPNHRVPVVTHMVWYRVGAADEPAGKSGIAHFLEHLLFKGSENLEPGEFSKIVRSLGGRDNAFTAHDYTAYFQSIAVEHLETVMKMESGRMRDLAVPENEVLSERKVILEERSQRTDNDPSGRFGEYLNAALYINHPYGIPVIGWRQEMEALSHKDAYDFYNQYYGPNNAILIVSGDVTGDQVLELAKKHYGRHKPVEITKRNFPKVPQLDGAAKITHSHPSIRQSQYQQIFRVPSYRINESDALTLEVIEDILGGGATSRLYKELVVEQKIATSAGLYYDPNRWSDAQFVLYATPAPNVDMETIEKAMEDELRKFVVFGVTDEELSDAISRLQAAAIYARDSVRGPAMIIGRGMITGSSLESIETWPRDIGTVTAENIKTVAKRYFDPDNSNIRTVTGYLLPEEKPETTQDNGDAP